MTVLRHAAAVAAALWLAAGPAQAQRFLPDAARAGGAQDFFITILNGANEVPPANTPALGYGAVFEDSGGTLALAVYEGLTGPAQMAHLHLGAPGTNGPVIAPLTVQQPDDGQAGGVVALTAEQQAALAAGNVYANVHTAAFPGGEIRGQLTAGRDVAASRADGAGGAVSALVYVQRARGAFAYVSDGDAGLTVRQPSGAFFDAVASGRIAAGTVLIVRGTLSEFRQLLQVNGADLTGFEVGPNIADNADTPVVPRPVTLEELAANGEAYESELVVLDDVVFPTPGLFTAATNYTVSDGSSPAVPVVLRVPGAADTEVDGTPIPSGPARVVGIASQFDVANPALGYQVLLIEPSDISMPTLGEAGTGAEALGLRITSPVRGRATVSFTLAEAGPVRLSVYDALGREVAVAAEGVRAEGAQSVRLDARSLAPGVYVVRLVAGRVAATRTFTVVR